MALINCVECDAKISDKAKACPRCGCPKQPEKDLVACRECEAIIPFDSSSCPGCGFPNPLTATDATEKQRENKACTSNNGDDSPNKGAGTADERDNIAESAQQVFFDAIKNNSPSEVERLYIKYSELLIRSQDLGVECYTLCVDEYMVFKLHDIGLPINAVNKWNQSALAGLCGELLMQNDNSAQLENIAIAMIEKGADYTNPYISSSEKMHHICYSPIFNIIDAGRCKVFDKMLKRGIFPEKKYRHSVGREKETIWDAAGWTLSGFKNKHHKALREVYMKHYKLSFSQKLRSMGF
jgi:RNA polymerase subunit RPABC4/transcription elongation factor Spt4